VIGHQERAALSRDVLDAFDLGAEPVAVEELVQRPIDQALEAFGPPPIGDATFGLEARQVAAQVRVRVRRAQRVTAPSAALETSRAYLASATPGYGLSGGC